MKYFIGIILSIFWTNLAQATIYELEPPNDDYISLNECLYAVTKGTKLTGGATDYYIYKNTLWSFAYSEADKHIRCELLGSFSE